LRRRTVAQPLRPDQLAVAVELEEVDVTLER
jgi:hypothetical protein